MDLWDMELQHLMEREQWNDRIPYPVSEMLIEDTRWPSPIKSIEEKQAELAAADTAYLASYGDDPRALLLLCDETELDLDRVWFESRRYAELKTNVRMFFQYLETDEFQMAVLLGTWLLNQHLDFGVEYDPGLLRLLKHLAVAVKEETALSQTRS